jgi:hypothetical protein
MRLRLVPTLVLALFTLGAVPVRAQSPAPSPARSPAPSPSPSAAAAPRPEPSATPVPSAKLEDSIVPLGIRLQLPRDWRVVGGNFESGTRALVLGPEGRDGEIVILRGEPAKGRTLQEFSSGADFPKGGHAVRVCNGTQDGWYADYADERGASDADRYTGFAVIAVNATNAVAAAYSRRRTIPDDATVRNAVMNLCVR